MLYKNGPSLSPLSFLPMLSSRTVATLLQTRMTFRCTMPFVKRKFTSLRRQWLLYDHRVHVAIFSLMVFLIMAVNLELRLRATTKSGHAPIFLHEHPEQATNKTREPKQSVPQASLIKILRRPVAVCIAGQLRSFHIRSVRNSILQHMIKPLREAGYGVHVFFHIAKSDHLHRNDSRIVAFAPLTVSKFHETKGCERPKCTRKRNTIYKTNCPFALYRADECLSEMQRFEQHNAMRFTWVYRTRPDVMFGTNVSLPQGLRTDTIYTNEHNPGTSVHAHEWLSKKFVSEMPKGGIRNAVGDHVIVGARKVAGVALGAGAAFRDCDLFDLPKGTLNAEVGLTYWLVKHGIRFETRPWFWILVRNDSSGADCERVRFIQRKEKKENMRLVHLCNLYNHGGLLLA